MSVLSLFCFSHSLAKALKKGDIQNKSISISILCMQVQGASYAMDAELRENAFITRAVTGNPS